MLRQGGKLFLLLLLNEYDDEGVGNVVDHRREEERGVAGGREVDEVTMTSRLVGDAGNYTLVVKVRKRGESV